MDWRAFAFARSSRPGFDPQHPIGSSREVTANRARQECSQTSEPKEKSKEPLNHAGSSPNTKPEPKKKKNPLASGDSEKGSKAEGSHVGSARASGVRRTKACKPGDGGARGKELEPGRGGRTSRLPSGRVGGEPGEERGEWGERETESRGRPGGEKEAAS